MASRMLTELALQRLTTPKSGRLEIGDKLTPGLVLRVTERGVRSWSVCYKVPGERGMSRTGRPLRGAQHRITLGQYPAVSLPKAREEARKIIEAAIGGRDPRPERREFFRERHENTVESVSRRMIKLAKKQIDSWEKIEQTLESHVWPTLGSRPIADIARADVHQLLDDLLNAGRKGTAREVRKHLSRLFNYATDKEIIAANPMALMRRRDLVQTPGERALTDEELRLVWGAAIEIGYPFGDGVRLLMLTGQRKSEWGDAMRSEINAPERVLEIAAERHKSRRGHVVPLSDPALRIVTAMPTSESDDYCVLSTTGGATPIVGWSKAKARMDAIALARLRETKNDPEAKLAGYKLHDLRRTCETRLARLGFNQEVRDAVLGHAKEGLQRTYNRYDYLQEKRSALDAYAAHIMGIVS